MAKSKKGFGTYSNDGLASPIEFSDEQLEKARRIVEQDLETIKNDFIAHLSRMKAFLEEKKLAIPESDAFANWFFDNKKIYQTGKNLPKIKDEQIAIYILEYNTYLTTLYTRKENTNKGLCSMNWKESDEKLLNLYTQLISNGFICPETTFENFKIAFSGTQIESISNKIVWLKIGKNKITNKKSISDFINVLVNHNYIDLISANITKILSNCFTSTKRELIFTQSNLAKNDDFSEFRIDLEKIVKSL